MLHMPEEVKCPRCNEIMASLQACHLICKNCGAHLDCSDKGSYWQLKSWSIWDVICRHVQCPIFHNLQVGFIICLKVAVGTFYFCNLVVKNCNLFTFWTFGIHGKNYQSSYIILISKPKLCGVSPDWQDVSFPSLDQIHLKL